MTTYRLPIDAKTPHFEFSSSLDGQPFVLRFDWNSRDACWYGSVYADDEDRTPIVTGKRISVPCRLLHRARGETRPAGEIVILDTGGTDTDPGRDDLGVRVAVYYVDEAGVAALGG